MAFLLRYSSDSVANSPFRNCSRDWIFARCSAISVCICSNCLLLSGHAAVPGTFSGGVALLPALLFSGNARCKCSAALSRCVRQSRASAATLICSRGATCWYSRAHWSASICKPHKTLSVMRVNSLHRQLQVTALLFNWATLHSAFISQPNPVSW
jgi:hypothetical protein